MKLAVTAAPRLFAPAWPKPSTAALYRLAGLSIAVGVPTLFWTLAFALVARTMGFAIGTPAIATFGLVIAAWALLGATFLMGKRSQAD